MDQAQAADPGAQKLWAMMKDVKVATMTTEDGEHLRSRPMMASQAEFDGTLWFFTRASAHKVEEVRQDDRVNVTYAEPSTQTYVSLSGRAALVRDRAAIDAHWAESLRTWFPKGRTDPEIALLKVVVQQAEYWDAPSSAMVHAFGYVKAVLTGTPPHPGENAKLTLE